MRGYAQKSNTKSEILVEISLNIYLEIKIFKKLFSILYYMMNTTNNILGQRNECLSIPICIYINDEEVEICKNLDRNSIIDIISKYNKDLASEINKMNIYEIQHPKTKKAYENLIKPLVEAFDNNNKYFNDKFQKYYKLNQDILNVVICHSLKRLWISIYYGSH